MKSYIFKNSTKKLLKERNTAFAFSSEGQRPCLMCLWGAGCIVIFHYVAFTKTYFGELKTALSGDA